MGDKLVSICIPHYNHSDLLRPLLDSLLKTIDTDTEIVICNNGSTDNSQQILDEYVEKWPNVVRVVKLKDNKGFAGGENEAYRAARGSYIMFLNNDIVSRSVGFIQRFRDADDGESLIGTQLIESNEYTAVLDYGPVPYLGGWCLFAPKKIFEEIGTFDEGVGKAFFEDVELSYRAVKAGYKLKLIESTGLDHLGSQTVAPDATELTAIARAYYRTRMIQYKREEEGNRRIIFIVPSLLHYNDYDWEGKGVGGAEAALINLTRSLAKLGQEVWVYNNCDKQGIFNGVHWAHISTFEYSDYADVAVIFRESFSKIERINATLKIFWSCDQYTTKDWKHMVFPYVDRIVAISPYHKWHLEEYWGVNPDKVVSIDLGVDAESYFGKSTEKVRGKMIFCSVPHRGLGHVAQIFPLIKKKVPNATLTITSDYTLWGGGPDNEEYRNLKDIKGITFLGKISREELVKHQLESELMLYPCNYEELFCISAAECIAAGAVPVTTAMGALPTTVADSGIIVRREMGTELSQIMADNAVELLVNDELRNKIKDAGIERMETYYTWEYLALYWLNFFQDLLKEKLRGGEVPWMKTETQQQSKLQETHSQKLNLQV